jgi:hypothetical protein
MEDIGSTTTPLTMLVMAPYFLVIFFNDNPLVMTIMSYVPFSAPVGMPVRLFLGTRSGGSAAVARHHAGHVRGGDLGGREDLQNSLRMGRASSSRGPRRGPSGQ